MGLALRAPEGLTLALLLGSCGDSQEPRPQVVAVNRRVALHSASSGDTAAPADTAVAPPVVLPSCDLPRARPTGTAPVRVRLDQVRTAWITVEPNRSYLGQVLAMVTQADGIRLLGVGVGGGTHLFDLPVRGHLDLLSDAPNIVSPVTEDPGLRVADLGGDDGDDLVNEDYVACTPIPPGGHSGHDIACALLYGATTNPSFSGLDTDDWDGDGNDDLLLAWDWTNGTFPGAYPEGGAAVFRGPLPPGQLDPLFGTAPDAWYDVGALEIPGQRVSGPLSLILPDVDGDGVGEALVDGHGWVNIAPRDPPDPLGYNMGGFALFPGGGSGLQQIGDQRLLLAPVCDSDGWTFVQPLPTTPYDMGDLDGDGLGDLALLSDELHGVPGPGGAIWILTELAGLEGVHTYTEAASTVILGDFYMRQNSVIPVEDLNFDGLPELAVAFAGPIGVYLFLSPLPRGAVELEAADLFLTGVASSSSDFADALVSGDVDGDGVPDLVIGDQYGGPGGRGEVHVASGQGLRDALGLGDLDADGFTISAGDCDDGRADIHPGVVEVACSGVDDDCDLVATPDAPDADGDGVGWCDGDCDDADKERSPSFAEVVCNGADDDCDGDSSDTPDADVDGVGLCEGDCDDQDATRAPSFAEVTCNAVDDDCSDTTLDAPDADADGVGLCDGDCDDQDATRTPSLAEVTCNTVDDDCDDTTADWPDADADRVGLCEGDCDDLDATRAPSLAEVTCNAVDDDCETATTDTPDADADGVGLCEGDCDDQDAGEVPGGVEATCNGLDDDCDTVTEDAPDADGDGASLCDADCDDADPTRSPELAEVACTGADEDCDPATVDDDGSCDPPPTDGTTEPPPDDGGGCGCAAPTGSAGWLLLAPLALVRRRRA